MMSVKMARTAVGQTSTTYDSSDGLKGKGKGLALIQWHKHMSAAAAALCITDRGRHSA